MHKFILGILLIAWTPVVFAEEPVLTGLWEQRGCTDRSGVEMDCLKPSDLPRKLRKSKFPLQMRSAEEVKKIPPPLLEMWRQEEERLTRPNRRRIRFSVGGKRAAIYDKWYWRQRTIVNVKTDEFCHVSKNRCDPIYMLDGNLLYCTKEDRCKKFIRIDQKDKDSEKK